MSCWNSVTLTLKSVTKIVLYYVTISSEKFTVQFTYEQDILNIEPYFLDDFGEVCKEVGV